MTTVLPPRVDAGPPDSPQRLRWIAQGAPSRFNGVGCRSGAEPKRPGRCRRVQNCIGNLRRVARNPELQHLGHDADKHARDHGQGDRSSASGRRQQPTESSKQQKVIAVPRRFVKRAGVSLAHTREPPQRPVQEVRCLSGRLGSQDDCAPETYQADSSPTRLPQAARPRPVMPRLRRVPKLDVCHEPTRSISSGAAPQW